MQEPVSSYEPPRPAPLASAAPRHSFLVNPVLGWALAPLPILTCSLLTFVPFLRSGLIRPRQRWPLIGGGLALQVAAIVCLMTIGNAPEDASGHVTGLAADVATGAWLLVMVLAVVLAVVFRDPVRADLNRLPAGVIAKRAGIPLHEAEQVVAQRHVLGRFVSVEQAIEAADLADESAVRLLDVGVV